MSRLSGPNPRKQPERPKSAQTPRETEKSAAREEVESMRKSMEAMQKQYVELMRQREAAWETQKAELESRVMNMTEQLGNIGQELQNERQENIVMGRDLRSLREDELSRRAEEELRNRKETLAAPSRHGMPKSQPLEAIQEKSDQEIRFDRLRKGTNMSRRPTETEVQIRSPKPRDMGMRPRNPYSSTQHNITNQDCSVINQPHDKSVCSRIWVLNNIK